jgi:RNA polymerase sigma-70 factor, ECF subfamily
MGVAEGNQRCFAELYDRLCGLLNSTAYHVLYETSEVEDVLQEVFVKIWHRSHLYSADKGDAVSWLVVITRNTALNRLRSKKRNHAAMERAAHEPTLTEKSDGMNAYEHSVALEDASAVHQALSDLPDEQREVLNLAFLKGLTHDEIAALLKMPLGSVKSRLRRGLTRMKNSIDILRSKL